MKMMLICHAYEFNSMMGMMTSVLRLFYRRGTFNIPVNPLPLNKLLMLKANRNTKLKLKKNTNFFLCNTSFITEKEKQTVKKLDSKLKQYKK